MELHNLVNPEETRGTALEDDDDLFEDACEEAEESTCGLPGCGPLVGLPDLLSEGELVN